MVLVGFAEQWALARQPGPSTCPHCWSPWRVVLTAWVSIQGQVKNLPPGPLSQEHPSGTSPYASHFKMGPSQPEPLSQEHPSATSPSPHFQMGPSQPEPLLGLGGGAAGNWEGCSCLAQALSLVVGEERREGRLAAGVPAALHVRQCRVRGLGSVSGGAVLEPAESAPPGNLLGRLQTPPSRLLNPEALGAGSASCFLTPPGDSGAVQRGLREGTFEIHFG